MVFVIPFSKYVSEKNNNFRISLSGQTFILSDQIDSWWVSWFASIDTNGLSVFFPFIRPPPFNAKLPIYFLQDHDLFPISFLHSVPSPYVDHFCTLCNKRLKISMFLLCVVILQVATEATIFHKRGGKAESRLESLFSRVNGRRNWIIGPLSRTISRTNAFKTWGL